MKERQRKAGNKKRSRNKKEREAILEETRERPGRIGTVEAAESGERKETKKEKKVKNKTPK